MVSGDHKVCKEVKTFLKKTVLVQVKKGLDVEGGILLTREKARDLIIKGAENAVKNCKNIPPFVIKKPVRMRLELVSRGRLPRAGKNVRIIDGRTYETIADSVEGALNLIG